MNFRRKRASGPALDLTPMIDVTFQLVLFFMVTTVFAVHPVIEVDLPVAAIDVAAAENDDLVVWVAADGRVAFGGTEVADAEWSGHFAAAAALDATVVLKADRDVPHGRVVELMDAAQAAGLSRFAIATEAPPPAP